MKMAVILRCHCFSLPPSPPQYTLPGKSFVLRKLPSHLFKSGKSASSDGDDVLHGWRENSQMSQESTFICSQLTDIVKVKLSPQCDSKGVCETVSSSSGTTVRVQAIACIVTNVLMFTMPLRALAECEASNSVFSMPLLLSVALIGATVGGLLARQRKGELQRLNVQLRQINASLRRQAKIESYAPKLSYAPAGIRISDKEVIIDPLKDELISRLKAGKNFLRTQDPGKALIEFKAALELAQKLEDPTKEKKAARGLGASFQRLCKYQEAIKYHSHVLAISEKERENSGNTEAYGAIADCHTELGDLEQAANFYDKYIANLENE